MSDIQLQLRGDSPRNATWPDPLDQLRQLGAGRHRDGCGIRCKGNDGGHSVPLCTDKGCNPCAGWGVTPGAPGLWVQCPGVPRDAPTLGVGERGPGLHTTWSPLSSMGCVDELLDDFFFEKDSQQWPNARQEHRSCPPRVDDRQLRLAPPC